MLFWANNLIQISLVEIIVHSYHIDECGTRVGIWYEPQVRRTVCKRKILRRLQPEALRCTGKNSCRNSFRLKSLSEHGSIPLYCNPSVKVMPVVIKVFFIKLVFIIIIVAGAYAIAEINVYRIVEIPASQCTPDWLQKILSFVPISIYSQMSFLIQNLYVTCCINLPPVVIRYKTCLVNIITEIGSDIIVSDMIIEYISLACKTHNHALCDQKDPGALPTN